MNLSRTFSTLSLCVLLGGAVVTTAGCAGAATKTGRVVDDSVITTKVNAKFVQDPVVSAMGIQVETYNGTVQLSGFAKSAEEMTRAAELARTVEGVKSVKNDIRLRSQ